MEILVKDPAHPNDRDKAKALTAEQLDKINPWLVERLNSRKRLTDAEVLDKLKELGCPMDFGPPRYTCRLCGAELNRVEVKLPAGASYTAAVFVSAKEGDPLPQYCWADPVHGSQRHEAKF